MVSLLAWLRSSFLGPLCSWSPHLSDVWLLCLSIYHQDEQRNVKIHPLWINGTITFFSVTLCRAALLLLMIRVLTSRWLATSESLMSVYFLGPPLPLLQVKLLRKQTHHMGVELGNVLGKHACRREEKCYQAGEENGFSISRDSASPYDLVKFYCLNVFNQTNHISGIK